MNNYVVSLSKRSFESCTRITIFWISAPELGATRFLGVSTQRTDCSCPRCCC